MFGFSTAGVAPIHTSDTPGSRFLHQKMSRGRAIGSLRVNSFTRRRRVSRQERRAQLVWSCEDDLHSSKPPSCTAGSGHGNRHRCRHAPRQSPDGNFRAGRAATGLANHGWGYAGEVGAGTKGAGQISGHDRQLAALSRDRHCRGALRPIARITAAHPADRMPAFPLARPAGVV